MRIHFVNSEWKIELVGESYTDAIPPVENIWLWDPGSKRHYKIYKCDKDWIDGLEVKSERSRLNDEYNFYLHPSNCDREIYLNPNVKWPDRVNLTESEFKNVIQYGKNSGVWVKRDKDGVHFVKNKNYCRVEKMAGIVVVDDKDEVTSLKEYSYDLSEWSVHDVVYTGKTILIYGINTSNTYTTSVKGFIEIACALIFGDKGAFSYEKKNVASMLIPILGIGNIESLDGMCTNNVTKLIQDTLTMSLPDHASAAIVVQNKQLLVSLFEGVHAMRYVDIKGSRILAGCKCVINKNGCLIILTMTGDRLSEAAERYFGLN